LLRTQIKAKNYFFNIQLRKKTLYLEKRSVFVKKIKPMQNYTHNILLLGNHAALHADVFLENSNQHKIIQLKFEPCDLFDDFSANKLWIDKVSFETTHNYTIEGLIVALKAIDAKKILTDVTLIVGDPSELLYQAYLFYMLNENPNDFVGSTFEYYNSETLNLFLYPVGMPAQDIRKELSNLMYCLKKHEMPTYLIRKEEKDLDALFKLLLHSLTFMSIIELEDQIKGIEHLVSPRLSTY